MLMVTVVIMINMDTVKSIREKVVVYTLLVNEPTRLLKHQECTAANRMRHD